MTIKSNINSHGVLTVAAVGVGSSHKPRGGSTAVGDLSASSHPHTHWLCDPGKGLAASRPPNLSFLICKMETIPAAC